jgi:hypothetical protein
VIFVKTPGETVIAYRGRYHLTIWRIGDLVTLSNRYQQLATRLVVPNW